MDTTICDGGWCPLFLIALTDNLLHLLLRGEDRVVKTDLGSASERAV